MDKETIVLIVAQNGLSTAATLLTASTRKIEKQLLKETDDAKRALLERKLTRAKKLATALTIADASVSQYFAETAAE